MNTRRNLDFITRTLISLLLVLSISNPSTTTVYGLSNSVNIGGSASSIPASLSAAGFTSLFSQTPLAGSTGVSIGDMQLFFLRLFTYDGANPAKSYTSAFGVKVDDYSELVVPNSLNVILPSSPQTGAYVNMSILYYKTSPTTGANTVICALSPRRMWTRQNGQDYLVNFREVLVTVTAGLITGCDWAPTNCIGQLANVYTLDSICADYCPAGVCNYNLTMFVSWTGTDLNGETLTSYNRDLYRLENSFA